jgi:hypothetical protein
MNTSLDRPTTGDGFLAQTAVRAGRALGRAELFVRRIPQPPPWLVLGALVVASWGIAAEAGLIAQHDGRLYYNGGDSTWYYTTAWALGNGHLPLAAIGYGYSLLIAPFAAIAGPNILNGMPWIIAFNQLVLAPIALVSIYGIVRLFAGRWYAYLTTLLWVIAPVLVIHYFLADYHTQYVDVALPQEVGLTALGDFPSMVVLLVAAYFLLRHLQTRASVDVVAAGLAAGLAVVVKPANLLFLPAAAGALLVAWRPRSLGVFALALIPALVGLTIWKYRGLGYLPVFENAAPLAFVLPLVAGLDFHRYVNLNWWHLHHNLDGLREFTWSQRMIYFCAGGGLIGLGRRSLPAATLAGLWLASYVVVKGSSKELDMRGGDFLPHLIAAFPAFFLLVVSIPFLVPVYGGRRPPSPVQPSSPQRLPKAACAVLGAILVIGLVAVSALPTISRASAADLPFPDLYVPLDGFALTAKTSGDAVTLSWPKQGPKGTRVSYAIFRAQEASAGCTTSDDPHPKSKQCGFNSPQIGSVDGGSRGGEITTFTDHPPPGRWSYRVAMSATPFGPQRTSDYTLISRAVPVTVRASASGQ